MKKLIALLLAAILPMIILTGCFSSGKTETVKSAGEITVFAPNKMKDALEQTALRYTNVDDHPECKTVSIIFRFESAEDLKALQDAGTYCDLFFHTGETQLSAISTTEILSGPNPTGETAVYSVSLITNSDRQDVANAFVAFLQGDEAQGVLSQYGFSNQF